MKVPGITVLCILQLAFTQGDVERIGNDIIPNDSSPSFNNRTVSMLREFNITEGVLFGFSAYFVNKNPMSFMVWRPDSGNTYQLVKRWDWTPNVRLSREDIHLHIPEGYTCLKLQPHDRLAVYHPLIPGSVAYTFDDNLGYEQRMIYPIGQEPEMGSKMIFDALAYPYTFSLAAWIDTDMSKYPTNTDEPECPSDLLIGGGYKPPTNGADGSTGATGAAGNPGREGAEGPSGDTGSTGPRGSNGMMGDTGHTGRHGDTGLMGPQGAMGFPGYTGPIGATGSQGEMGERGDKGEEGPPGPVGQSAQSLLEEEYSSCVWCEKFFNPYMVMGVVIWLAALTLIFLTYVLVNCCCCGGSSRRDSKQEELWRKYENKGFNGKNENMYSEVDEGRTEF